MNFLCGLPTILMRLPGFSAQFKAQSTHFIAFSYFRGCFHYPLCFWVSTVSLGYPPVLCDSRAFLHLLKHSLWGNGHFRAFPYLLAHYKGKPPNIELGTPNHVSNCILVFLHEIPVAEQGSHGNRYQGCSRKTALWSRVPAYQGLHQREYRYERWSGT